MNALHDISTIGPAVAQALVCSLMPGTTGAARAAGVKADANPRALALRHAP